MGSIKVKLDCGHIIATHTDNLLEHGWTFEKIMERTTDKHTDTSNPSIYHNDCCVDCFSRGLAEMMFDNNLTVGTQFDR
jgi:hypothetical protein